MAAISEPSREFPAMDDVQEMVLAMYAPSQHQPGFPPPRRAAGCFLCGSNEHFVSQCPHLALARNSVKSASEKAINGTQLLLRIAWYLTTNKEELFRFRSTLPLVTEQKDGLKAGSICEKAVYFDQIVIDEECQIPLVRFRNDDGLDFTIVKERPKSKHAHHAATYPEKAMIVEKRAAKELAPKARIESTFMVTQILKPPSNPHIRPALKMPEDGKFKNFLYADNAVLQLKAEQQAELRAKRWKQRLDHYEKVKRHIMKTAQRRSKERDSSFTATEAHPQQAESVEGGGAAKPIQTPTAMALAAQAVVNKQPRPPAFMDSKRSVRFETKLMVHHFDDDLQINFTEETVEEHEDRDPQPVYTLTRVESLVAGMYVADLPLDSCATSNIVSKQFLDSFQHRGRRIPIRKLKHRRLTRGVGGLKPFVGHCTLRVAVGDQTAKTVANLDFYVIDDEHISILVGTPGLHDLGVKMDFTKEIISFETESSNSAQRMHSIPMKFKESAPRRLSSKNALAYYSRREVDDFLVPLILVEDVNLQPTTETTDSLLIEPKRLEMDVTNPDAAPEDLTFKHPLLYMSQYPRTLKKGSVLAYIDDRPGAQCKAAIPIPESLTRSEDVETLDDLMFLIKSEDKISDT
ncbi:hypothetical protein HDU96_003118, partial [Phlyctochytrium bullatum]